MLLLGGFLRLLFFHVLGGSDCAYNKGKEEQVDGFYPDTCQNGEQRKAAPGARMTTPRSMAATIVLIFFILMKGVVMIGLMFFV